MKLSAIVISIISFLNYNTLIASTFITSVTANQRILQMENRIRMQQPVLKTLYGTIKCIHLPENSEGTCNHEFIDLDGNKLTLENNSIFHKPHCIDNKHQSQKLKIYASLKPGESFTDDKVEVYRFDEVKAFPDKTMPLEGRESPLPLKKSSQHNLL